MLSPAHWKARLSSMEPAEVRIIAMHKFAAIDAGSNALRMVIASLNRVGQLELEQNIRIPVRLGADVFSTGALSSDTMRLATEAFRRFRDLADQAGVTQLRAIATSALREAANRDLLLDRISATSGVEVDVISGAEEARLIHRAVASRLNLTGKRALLIDIGGGSVEVTLCSGRNILSTESYRLGAVRLLQELDGGRESAPDQPLSARVNAYAESARQRIRRQLRLQHINLCAATGGTAEDLGRLSQKRFKKSTDTSVSLGELDALVEAMERMNVRQRARKFDLRPDRADVILPAALVLQTIMREAHVRRAAIPHVGLKDGLLIEMAEEAKRGRPPLRRAQVLLSAARLGRKYESDSAHAALTARLAVQLFDQCTELHNLGPEARVLLEAGALLHDIGHFIAGRAHDRHGHYILKASPLIGLDEEQQEIVASLARYHRTPPSDAEDGFRQLSRRQRTMIARLSALLLLADGMDASHTGRARSVTLSRKKRQWQLSLHGRGDLSMEGQELEKRRGVFQKIFGMPLEIKVKD